ncbi:hypothetical protein JHFBIEKO_0246 [Methylobacterium mesophilicum]|nr:hypothetical protein JHFBIEKO_0246 [Methylobacterium mesophilicum]
MVPRRSPEPGNVANVSDADLLPEAPPVGVPGPSDDTLGRLPIHHLRWSSYASVIHPEDTRGVCVLTYTARVMIEGIEEPRTRSAGAKGHELAETVRRHRPKFMTLSAFREPKPTKDGKPGRDYRESPCKAFWNLSSLGALWVDLDFYNKKAYRHGTPRTMVPLVLARLQDLGLPLPSYIMSSGKGLLAVWLHTRLLPAMHPVWKAVQKCLNDSFIDMGRDIQAMACTSNFRVAGSTNDKRTVEVLWPAYVDQIERFDFDMLRTEILPYTPEQVREYRKVQARKKAAKAESAAARKAEGRPAPSVRLNRVTYSKAVVKDLYNLFEARFQGHPVQKGERDTWLYHLTVAAAWVMEPDALKTEVRRLAPLCGLSCTRAVTLMGSVIAKARRAAQGHSATYKRRSVDPRYRTNPQMLVDCFGVTVEEAGELDLRVIAPRALKTAREAERSLTRRRDAGAQDRTLIQAQRLAFGRFALERKAAGTRVEDIAFEGKRSVSYVEKAMREARVVASIGKGQVKPKAGRPRKAPKPISEKPFGSTVSIDAGTSPKGLDAEPRSVVARGDQAYADGVRNVHHTGLDTTPALAPVEAGVAVSEVDEDFENGQPQKVNGVWRHWDGSQWTPTPVLAICLWNLEAGTLDELKARHPSAPYVFA